MCGIGLFSLQPNSRNYQRTLLVQMLLASVAERGEDACGYAWQKDSGEVEVQRGYKNTALFLPEVNVNQNVRDAIVHVRDYTKGHPGSIINNHPLVYQQIVGVHNGIIQNDDLLFEKYKAGRPNESTVDSLAIFMLLAKLNNWQAVVKELIGSYNTFWYDQRHPGQIHVLRGAGRPLWQAQADDILLLASTHEALYFIGEGLRINLAISAIPPGTYMVIEKGKAIKQELFYPELFKEGDPALYDPTVPHAIAAREYILPLLAEILHPEVTASFDV